MQAAHVPCRQLKQIRYYLPRDYSSNMPVIHRVFFLLFIKFYSPTSWISSLATLAALHCQSKRVHLHISPILQERRCLSHWQIHWNHWRPTWQVPEDQGCPKPCPQLFAHAGDEDDGAADGLKIKRTAALSDIRRPALWTITLAGPRFSSWSSCYRRNPECWDPGGHGGRSSPQLVSEASNHMAAALCCFFHKIFLGINLTWFPGLKHFSGSGYFINILFFTSQFLDLFLDSFRSTIVMQLMK